MNLTIPDDTELTEMAAALDLSPALLKSRLHTWDAAASVLRRISEDRQRSHVKWVRTALERQHVSGLMAATDTVPEQQLTVSPPTPPEAKDVASRDHLIDWHAWEPGPRTTRFCCVVLMLVVSLILSGGLLYGIRIGHDTDRQHRINGGKRVRGELRSFQPGYTAQQFRKWVRSMF